MLYKISQARQILDQLDEELVQRVTVSQIIDDLELAEPQRTSWKLTEEEATMGHESTFHCSECVQEGKTSTIHSQTGPSTAAGIHSFWDQQGRRHVHDPNKTVVSYHCSYGHAWDAQERNQECWCGWPETGPQEATMSDESKEFDGLERVIKAKEASQPLSWQLTEDKAAEIFRVYLQQWGVTLADINDMASGALLVVATEQAKQLLESLEARRMLRHVGYHGYVSDLPFSRLLGGTKQCWACQMYKEVKTTLQTLKGRAPDVR